LLSHWVTGCVLFQAETLANNAAIRDHVRGAINLPPEQVLLPGPSTKLETAKSYVLEVGIFHRYAI
jgi:hypothetical protein